MNKCPNSDILKYMFTVEESVSIRGPAAEYSRFKRWSRVHNENNVIYSNGTVTIRFLYQTDIFNVMLSFCIKGSHIQDSISLALTVEAVRSMLQCEIKDFRFVSTPWASGHPTDSNRVQEIWFIEDAMNGLPAAYYNKFLLNIWGFQRGGNVGWGRLGYDAFLQNYMTSQTRRSVHIFVFVSFKREFCFFLIMFQTQQ